MWGQRKRVSGGAFFLSPTDYPQNERENYNMKLNVYEKKQIVKTYEVDTYDLMFGVIEDVADAIKLDELKNGTDAEIIKMAGNLVLHSMDTVKDLFKDIFEGITDEELKKCKVSEMAIVLVDVVKYTLNQLGKGFGGKN